MYLFCASWPWMMSLQIGLSGEERVVRSKIGLFKVTLLARDRTGIWLTPPFSRRRVLTTLTNCLIREATIKWGFLFQACLALYQSYHNAIISEKKISLIQQILFKHTIMSRCRTLHFIVWLWYLTQKSQLCGLFFLLWRLRICFAVKSKMRLFLKSVRPLQ